MIQKQKLFIEDPRRDYRAHGHWAGKYSPDQPVTMQGEGSADKFFDTAPPSEDESEETIPEVRGFVGVTENKSELFLDLSRHYVSSDNLFEIAKAALRVGDTARYLWCKSQLEDRMDKQTEEYVLKHLVPTGDGAGAPVEGVGTGSDNIGVKPPKKREKTKIKLEEILGDVTKAIFTKNKDKAEKKAQSKRAAKKVPKKVSKLSSKDGKKTYKYNSSKPTPKAKKKASPSRLAVEPQAPQTVNPDRLAALIGTSTANLKSLAQMYDLHKFRAYFKGNHAKFLKKHQIPDSYLDELHKVLSAKMEVKKGRKMTKVDVETMRKSHVDGLRRTTFSPGDLVFHNAMGLGVVFKEQAEDEGISVSFNPKSITTVGKKFLHYLNAPAPKEVLKNKVSMMKLVSSIKE